MSGLRQQAREVSRGVARKTLDKALDGAALMSLSEKELADYRAAHVILDPTDGWAARALDEARDAAKRLLDGTAERRALFGIAALREHAVDLLEDLGLTEARTELEQLAAGNAEHEQLVEAREEAGTRALEAALPFVYAAITV